MNASLWQLAGWTMIHSLWLGAAVALAGGFLRLACRRAAPNTRYAISLATLTALAVTPFAAAAWLSVNGVPQVAAANLESPLLPLPLGEGWGEGQNPLSTTPPANATVENPSPNLSLQGRGIKGTPGRMPGLSGQVIDLAHTNPSPRYSGERLGEGLNPPSTTPQTSATVENPSPTPSLPERGIAVSLPASHTSSTYSPTHVLTYSLRYLPTLWLIGAPLTFTLLATGLLGSARLRRRAAPLTSGAAFDACQRLRQTLNITRRVALAVSDGVAQPILVGVLRPLILLPTAALAGWTPEQLDMVLLHELAHVRRWDNLVNLLQRIVESLIFFHPAVWLVSRQVRRDREECCDAAVIRHTDRPHQYAELLVSIAAALRGGPAPSLAVASAMASHPLAGRIRRILNLEEEPMRITRRTLAATLLLPLLLAGAIFYTGASAQDPPPSQGAEQPSTVASGERAQGGSPREVAGEGVSDVNVLTKALADLEERRVARIEAEKRLKAASEKQSFSYDEMVQTAFDLELSHDSTTRLLQRQADVISKMLDRKTASGVNGESAAVKQLQDSLAHTKQEITKRRDEISANARKRVGAPRDEQSLSELQNSTRHEIIRRANAEVGRAEMDFEKSLQRLLQLTAGDPGSPHQGGEATGDNANNDQPTANAPPRSAASAQTTTSPYAHSGVEFTQLQNEIRNLEALIIETQKELVDYEVYQELIGQSGRPDGGFEAAIAKDLDADPAVNAHKQQLFELQVELQTKLTATKNRNSAEIKRLRETIRNVEGELAKYVSEASRVLRKKHAQLPKDAQLAAQREYDARRSALGKNLSKYEQDLAAANAKLSQLKQSSHDSDPQPAPLLDRLEQLRLAFDAQRPLFIKQTGEHLQKVRYDGANLPDIVGDHWPYLVKGISNEPGKSPVWFNWTGLGNKNYELEVPAAAHEKFFRPMFDGTLPTLAGTPGSPNQGGAATGSGADKAQSTAQDSPYSAPSDQEPLPSASSRNNLGQADLRTVLAESKARLERQLAELKKGASKAEDAGVEAELAAASALEQKVLEWEVMNRARGSLQAKQLQDSAEPSSVSSPGSPNQGGAVTGSSANDAQPTANASPGSAAPVQEPEPPATPAGSSQEGLKQVLSDASSRLRHEIFDLKKRAAEASGAESEAEIAAALEQKVQQWRALAGAPGSPNQGGAATGSNANDAQPTADASPGSAAPVQEPEPPSSPFPTLENQKIADRAYKLLGLELEPLTPTELERVKKLGYNGGLRVATHTIPSHPDQDAFEADDLLVGLHVWPVTDLKSLDEVLKRDDLGELNPLKYYVIRKKGGRGFSDDLRDSVVTGRLSIPEAESLSRDLARTDQTHAEMAAVRAPSDFTPISVVQPPTTQKTSIFGGTVTTAYLKVKFDRLPYAFDNANARLTPQEIERSVMKCLAAIRSPNVLKAALKVAPPRDMVNRERPDAVIWLQDRLSTTFPGDGEILELKLEGGDAKEDEAILQAVIDAFIAATKTPPKSPADPNATAVPPGDLNQYIGRDVNPAPANANYQHPALFAKALERSRKSGKPVVVHLLDLDSDPSEQFANNILADPQVADFIRKNFDAITIYPEYHPAFAKAFHINRVPADMFIFAGGERIAGGVTPPATPELYLAHLKTHHKLATNQSLQNGDAPLVPTAPVAPAADRPGDENAPTNSDKPATAALKPGDAVFLKVAGAFPEAPLDGAFFIEPEGTLPLGPLYGRVAVAGKTVLEAEEIVKEHLSKTLTDVAVQLTLATNKTPAAATSQDGASSSPTFLYDGKTFEEWRDLWKLELNPERRTEAINALAAFGRTGHGQEAADAILAVAGEYPESYSPTSSEGKLLAAIRLAVARMPAKQWMPPVQARIVAAEEPEKSRWIRYAASFMGATHDSSDEARELAAKFAEIPSDDLLTATALYLYRNDQSFQKAETIELMRRALQQKSPGIDVTSFGFRHLDKVSEQLDVLVRNGGARSALNTRIADDKEMAARLYSPLLEMLKDPNRAEDRIGVLRALRVIGPVVRKHESLENRRQITSELTELLRTAPDDLLPAVFVTYSKYWGSSNYDEILSSLLEQGQLPAERIKHLRELEQAMYEEAHAP